MSGLGSWVQYQWVDRQRRLWREHDAKLAEVWRDESLAATKPSDVDKPSDVGKRVIVLPDTQGARDGSPIGS